MWTPLYAMIALAGWQLWRRPATRGAALAAWGVQLALNALWSYLFFGLHRPSWALVDVVALDAAIAATIGLAWRPNRPAAWLLLPYLGWVSFATILNATLWQLNR